MNRNYKYYIGIDCGVNTGIACYDKQKKELCSMGTLPILKAIANVKWFCGLNPGGVLIRIEDPRLRTWIPKQKNETAERGRNRGAGSVMRDAQIWQEFLEAENIPHEFVAPKNNKTKTTAEYFKLLTGWTEKTNEHSRDAAMLVFGF